MLLKHFTSWYECNSMFINHEYFCPQKLNFNQSATLYQFIGNTELSEIVWGWNQPNPEYSKFNYTNNVISTTNKCQGKTGEPVTYWET